MCAIQLSLAIKIIAMCGRYNRSLYGFCDNFSYFGRVQRQKKLMTCRQPGAAQNWLLYFWHGNFLCRKFATEFKLFLSLYTFILSAFHDYLSDSGLHIADSSEQIVLQQRRVNSLESALYKMLPLSLGWSEQEQLQTDRKTNKLRPLPARPQTPKHCQQNKTSQTFFFEDLPEFSQV